MHNPRKTSSASLSAAVTSETAVWSVAPAIGMRLHGPLKTLGSLIPRKSLATMTVTRVMIPVGVLGTRVQVDCRIRVDFVWEERSGLITLWKYEGAILTGLYVAKEASGRGSGSGGSLAPVCSISLRRLDMTCYGRACIESARAREW